MILCIICAIADGFYSGDSGTSGDLYEIGAEPSTSTIIDALVTLG